MCPQPGIDTATGGGSPSGKRTSGSYNIPLDALENVIKVYTPDQYGEIEAHIEMTTPLPAWLVGDVGKIATLRLRQKIDGVNFRIIDETQFLIGTSTWESVLRGYVSKGPNTCEITIQMNFALANAYLVDWEIIEGGI